MPSFSTPSTARMASQQRDNMLRYAGETATLWSYISAAGGVSVAGFAPTAYSAGRTITAHMYVARGFLYNIQQKASPAGMIPAGDFQLALELKPGVNDRLEYRGITYKLEGEPAHEPFTNSWVCTVKRAGT